MATDRSFAHSVFLGEGLASAVPRRAPALLAVAFWLIAGLSIGYWVLHVLGRSPVTPVASGAVMATAPEPASLARVLGAPPELAASVQPVSAPPLASRFQLIGVVADAADGGAALIAVDGQPPRPYRVGASLDGGLVLQSVQRRSVRLAPSAQGTGQAIELSLPEPPATPS
ncbi:MAG: general secretion pathway protein C [Hydrogenophaga sp.]|jgi:general secretion pathway protein C|nr:general secretion pathway protein C [Hydrogenophaga sp.]